MKGEKMDTFVLFPLKTGFDALAGQNYTPSNVIHTTKMQSEDFVSLMTVVISVFRSHIPRGLGEAGSRLCHLCLSSLNLFQGCPALVAASSPSLLCCHLMPRSLCGATSNR